jgi:hypothetical protein
MSTELKRILNRHEEATHRRLRVVCDTYGSHVYAKVRVADVVPIENSGIGDELYRYALQSHFDFVVTDNLHRPAFAVEFDGPTHQAFVQRERDKKKNELCDKFDLPLLRVNARYLGKQYRDMDLLTWFVEVWFAQKWFEQAQEKGEILYDEPFMPQAIVNIPGSDKQFPLWLSAVVRAKIQKLCFTGAIRDLVPSVLIGKDTEGNYHAISFIRIDDSRGVVVETGMRLQRFPVLESEALDEVIICQLYEALVRALEVGDTASPGAEIERRIIDFTESYKMTLVSHSSSSYEIPSVGSKR